MADEQTFTRAPDPNPFNHSTATEQRDPVAEIAALRHRIEQMEGILAGLDNFLSKVNPETVERLLGIIDKYFPHGA